MGVQGVMGGTITTPLDDGDALEQRVLGRQLALVQVGKKSFDSVHESVWVGVSPQERECGNYFRTQ